MPPDSAPPDAPSDESGLSILRSDPAAVKIRERLERPPRIGRIALAVCGAVAVGASVGLGLARPSIVVVALLGFGLLLIVLGLVQGLLLRREQRHRPKEAHLWGEGVEVVLESGEIRVAGWGDPKFAMELYVRPSRAGGESEVLLSWQMDSRLPLFPITVEGSDRLRQMAGERGLQCVDLNPGNRRVRAIAIFARPLKKAAPKATKPKPTSF